MKKILVVDDDEVQCKVTSMILNSLGYIVSVVNSGEKAVEFLKHNRQDLVILDMVMPDGIDGAETYKRISEFQKNQKAIILSGYSETARVLKAQEMGVGRFVKKPITKKIIAEEVRAELDA